MRKTEARRPTQLQMQKKASRADHIEQHRRMIEQYAADLKALLQRFSANLH
jgi:hypothetical protein